VSWPEIVKLVEFLKFDRQQFFVVKQQFLAKQHLFVKQQLFVG